MIILVMGVSGSGKSTVGGRLAKALGIPFLDADSLHPAGNIAKMTAGVPLSDEDRWPWLDAVHRRMAGAAARGEGLVAACSALRGAYRRRLSKGIPDLRVVYLHATREVLRRRLLRRKDHFFTNPDLLDSQLATLEPPEDAIIIDVGRLDIDRAVAAVQERLEASASAGRSGS
jgi:carbohydrate kinase (thermoresistant glucokinase family)